MVNIEELLSYSTDELQEISRITAKDDLPALVELLAEKDDTVRYRAFLLLQYRAQLYDDVYPFWNVFAEKLKSNNSYQRNIGLNLIAENIKWDTDNKFDEIIDQYLLLLHDEKPITVRQCLQALCKIVPYKHHLHKKIADKVMGIKLSDVKETMRKSVLLDILSVLIMIRRHRTTDEIEKYIADSLAGGLLDKKALKQIKNML